MTRLASWLAATLALSAAGCSGGSGGSDGGGEDTGDGATGRLVVELTSEEESDGLDVAAASVGIARVRARNDRGGGLEPEREDVGRVDLLAEEPIVLEPAAPATYGRLEMRLEDGDWGPGVALTLDEPGRRLEIALGEDIDVEVSCETPTMLSPGAEARIHAELELESLRATLEELDVPSDGTVRIDETSEPEAAARLAEALESAWSLDCESEESESGE